MLFFGDCCPLGEVFMAIQVLTTGEGYALPRAFGTVMATGHLALAKDDDPKVFHLLLGTGPWSALRALYYRGEDITAQSATYRFHPGTPSAGFEDPVQGVDGFYPAGITYSEVAYLAWAPPADITDPDPAQLVGRYDCLQLPNFDAGGSPLPAGFTANNARVMIQCWIDAKRDLGRIHWPTWARWRDVCDEAINWNSGATPPHEPIKRFEAHVPFLSAIELSAAMTLLCDLSATIWQDDGLLIRFRPVLDDVVHFDFTEDNILRDSIAVYEIDVTELKTHQQVEFRNLDDPLLSPASITARLSTDADEDVEGREADPLVFGAMTYSQAQRIGKYALRRQLPKRASFGAFGSSFGVQPGDLVTINHPALGSQLQQAQVLEVEDQPSNADTRRFVVGLIVEPLYSDNDHEPITELVAVEPSAQ